MRDQATPTQTGTIRCDCFAPLPIAAVGASQRTICDRCLADIQNLSNGRAATSIRSRRRAPRKSKFGGRR